MVFWLGGATRVVLPGKGRILGVTPEDRKRHFRAVFGEGMEEEWEGTVLVATIILFMPEECACETVCRSIWNPIRGERQALDTYIGLTPCKVKKHTAIEVQLHAKYIKRTGS